MIFEQLNRQYAEENARRACIEALLANSAHGWDASLPGGYQDNRTTVNQFTFEGPVYVAQLPAPTDNTGAWIGLAVALAPFVLPLVLSKPKRSRR
jgi:hypothetical protein